MVELHAADGEHIVLELEEQEMVTKLVVAGICCPSEASIVTQLLEPMPGEGAGQRREGRSRGGRGKGAGGLGANYGNKPVLGS